MNRQRLIIAMGSGVDHHGHDCTKAARRAVDDALQHSALPILQRPDLDDGDIDIRVTIGVPAPDAVETDVLRPLFPRGTLTITVVPGGLTVAEADGAGGSVIATAAVEVFLPEQSVIPAV